MATYYDYILAFIPLVLLGLGGGLSMAGLGTHTALVVAGLVTLGLVGHALFINAPTRESQPSEHVEAVDGSSPAVSMSD